MPKYKIAVICIAVVILLWQAMNFVNASTQYQQGMSAASSHEGQKGIVYNDKYASGIKTAAATRYNADYKKSIVIMLVTVASSGLILLLPNGAKKET